MNDWRHSPGPRHLDSPRPDPFLSSWVRSRARSLAPIYIIKGHSLWSFECSSPAGGHALRSEWPFILIIITPSEEPASSQSHVLIFFSHDSWGCCAHKRLGLKKTNEPCQRQRGECTSTLKALKVSTTVSGKHSSTPGQRSGHATWPTCHQTLGRQAVNNAQDGHGGQLLIRSTYCSYYSSITGSTITITIATQTGWGGGLFIEHKPMMDTSRSGSGSGSDIPNIFVPRRTTCCTCPSYKCCTWTTTTRCGSSGSPTPFATPTSSTCPATCSCY